MKSATRITLAALAMALPCISLNAAVPLSRGHTDIGIAFEGGELEPHVHAETYELEYAPDQAVLRVLPQAEEVIPANPLFAFLGTPGNKTWLLSQDEATASSKNILFLGVGAEEMNAADFTGNLQVQLSSVAFTPEAGAPSTGTFAVFTVSPGGVPTVMMTTHDGIGAGDQFEVIPGTHFHANWAFSQPGRYQVTFAISGNLAAGGSTSASATYTFVVKSYTSPQNTQLARNEVLEVGGNFAQVSKITPVSVGDSAGSISVLTVKGFGASKTAFNATNDSLLAKLGNYEAQVIAREGDELAGIPGSRIKGFVDGLVSSGGQVAFTAMLLQGAGGTTTANDTVLAAQVYDALLDAFVPVPLLREGGGIDELPGFGWVKFYSYQPTGNGKVLVLGAMKNGTTGILKQVAVVVTAGTTPDVKLLAAVGESIVTDTGAHIVKSIQRTSRPGARAASNAGSVELLLGLDDGTTEVVSFPVQPLE